MAKERYVTTIKNEDFHLIVLPGVRCCPTRAQREQETRVARALGQSITEQGYLSFLIKFEEDSDELSAIFFPRLGPVRENRQTQRKTER